MRYRIFTVETKWVLGNPVPLYGVVQFLLVGVHVEFGEFFGAFGSHRGKAVDSVAVSSFDYDFVTYPPEKGLFEQIQVLTYELLHRAIDKELNVEPATVNLLNTPNSEKAGPHTFQLAPPYPVEGKMFILGFAD